MPITGFANSVASAAIEYQKEGQVFGIGVKIFTIAGPVILYGIFSSFVVGLIYLFTKQWGVVSMTSICGIQSLKFENAPYLKGWASVAGKKRRGRPLGKSDRSDHRRSILWTGKLGIGRRSFYETGSNACDQ